jgi:hypothetical protein
LTAKNGCATNRSDSRGGAAIKHAKEEFAPFCWVLQVPNSRDFKTI